MKNTLTTLVLFTAFFAQAQVGIGVSTATMAASAQLEVASTTKGFLPPRITLTGTEDVATISSPATGLFIYNTATAGATPNNVSPGLYYYDGSKWQRVINQLSGYATTSALDLKAPLASPTFTGTVAGITKTMVGLANVDDTTDLLKPISNDTQTALNLKANSAGQVFTGAISATNLSGTNSGDNAPNTLYSSLTTNANHTGDVTGSSILTIADGAVTTAKIADGAVTEVKIGALAVTEAKIGALAVTAAKIASGAVSAAKIADGSVTAFKIATAAVTEVKIGALAVTEAKIGALAVTEAKIGALAVTTAKIADGAVSAAKIGALAVTTAKIADGAVTDIKIDTVSGSKVTGTVAIANGGTGTSNGSITGTGALTFTASGTDQNVTLTPSGSGSSILNGSVGIGTSTPAASAQLEVTSTSKGFLPPRVALTGPDDVTTIVSPAEGLIVYNTTLKSVQVFNGTVWYSTAHYIGESYGGGIVFYVYDNGQHGLIAATSDQSTGIRWYGGTNINTRARGDGIGAGLKNTAIIIANQGPVDGAAFAATVCNEYSVTVAGVTYGDWYLPSKHELYLLFLKKAVVGGFDTNIYWSSTEFDNYDAWMQLFSNGAPYNFSKTGAICVRAVRAF